jgi:hypothetical protein
MRSAAVLLSSHRRGLRRVSRHARRARPRLRHRGGFRAAGIGVQRLRPTAPRRLSRRIKRRVRIVYAMPRGFLPLVRH